MKSIGNFQFSHRRISLAQGRTISTTNRILSLSLFSLSPPFSEPSNNRYSIIGFDSELAERYRYCLETYCLDGGLRIVALVVFEWHCGINACHCPAVYRRAGSASLASQLRFILTRATTEHSQISFCVPFFSCVLHQCVVYRAICSCRYMRYLWDRGRIEGELRKNW